MAYSVNNTVGTVISTVLDGQKDTTSTSLVFIGKSVVNYGEIQNENFLWLLENFSGPSEPAQPQEGQLWWDNVNKNMFVYISGSGWKPVSGYISSTSAPLNPIYGDQWWDATNEQLKVWNGTEWLLLAPVYSKLDGKTGALVENVYDAGATKHTITKIYSAGDVLATVSKYTEFTPDVAITGFSTIKPGIQLSSTLSDLKLHGTATNADALGTVPAANYLRTDANNIAFGSLRLRNSTFSVGASDQFSIVDNGTTLTFTSATNNATWSFVTNVNGQLTTSMYMQSGSGRPSTALSPDSGDNLTNKTYVDQRDNAVQAAAVAYTNQEIDIARKNYQFTSTGVKYQATVYVGTDAPNNGVGNNGDIWIRFY